MNQLKIFAQVHAEYYSLDGPICKSLVGDGGFTFYFSFISGSQFVPRSQKVYKCYYPNLLPPQLTSLEARQNVYKCYYVLIFHTF